ncbi:hypothetical protein WJX75_003877 [Coccomyxa subellipsoidea]|uniref:DNA-directed RNA polymerase III subunit n=1 Tax=Coccomyxa subellipsoidea TaxID=248742 RepID=A0ABR2YTH5_9CHLO
MTPAALRSEVGDAAAAELEKPPQLFPKIELPIVPDLDKDGTQLLGYWRYLTSFYKSSCYHLKTAEANKRSVEDDPYASLSRSKAVDRAPLSSVLTLDSKYFPEELFSATEKRASVRATSTKAFLPIGGMEAGADIFDRFAKLESGEGAEEEMGGKRRAGGGASTREEGQKERGADGQEDEEQLPEDEEDEVFEDEDDYLMGETFDDDEGYDDPYNDGDDEGPTY